MWGKGYDLRERDYPWQGVAHSEQCKSTDPEVCWGSNRMEDFYEKEKKN